MFPSRDSSPGCRCWSTWRCSWRWEPGSCGGKWDAGWSSHSSRFLSKLLYWNLRHLCRFSEKLQDSHDPDLFCSRAAFRLVLLLLYKSGLQTSPPIIPLDRGSECVAEGRCPVFSFIMAHRTIQNIVPYIYSFINVCLYLAHVKKIEKDTINYMQYNNKL